MFPTWSEVLEVLVGLGYSKVPEGLLEELEAPELESTEVSVLSVSSGVSTKSTAKVRVNPAAEVAAAPTPMRSVKRKASFA